MRLTTERVLDIFSCILIAMGDYRGQRAEGQRRTGGLLVCSIRSCNGRVNYAGAHVASGHLLLSVLDYVFTRTTAAHLARRVEIPVREPLKGPTPRDLLRQVSANQTSLVLRTLVCQGCGGYHT